MRIVASSQLAKIHFIIGRVLLSKNLKLFRKFLEITIASAEWYVIMEITATALRPTTTYGENHESTDPRDSEVVGTDSATEVETSDGTIVRESWPSWQANKLHLRIPERSKYNAGSSGEHWKFGANDLTAEIINQAWPANQIVWKDDDAKTMFRYLLANKARQDLNAENVAHFKEHNGIIPVHSYDLHETMPLAKYQQLGLCNSADNEGYALFMEQGTGKTAIVVSRICNEAKRYHAKTKLPYLAIIVCPKQLRFNWELEFHKFATERGRLTRIAGSELKRTKGLIEALDISPEDKFSVVIISYDSLGRTAGLKRIPWNLGVLDESHFVKNMKTKRWKACRDLRDQCKARMVLTGTPITNTVMDLYTQWEFLGEGWSGFVSYEGFKRFYGVYEESDQSGFKKLVGVQNLPFMKERLARQALVIKKDEVLKDLPDKQYDVVEVEMSPEQAEIYAKVRDNLAHEIEELDNQLSGSESNKQMTVNNILTKMLRLAQVTSGHVVYDAVYGPDGETLVPKQVDRVDPNPKVEAVVELLKEKTYKDKTIIWACFVPDIKLLAARLRLEGIDAVTFYGGTSDADREEAVRRFNEDPKCKVFIGNATAGGTGLTLLGYPPGHEHADLYDTNANHVLYFSQNWSMPARAQSEDRCHRRGTREPVRYTDLIIPDTIDGVIRERVSNKIDVANSVANVRDLLRAVFTRDF